MNQSKVVGTVEELINAVQANAQAITAAGGNPAAIMTELTAKKDLAVTKGVEHENLKTSLKNKAEEAQAANQGLYETFSNKIDSVCGTVGKKSHLGRQIAKVRAKLRSRGPSATGSSDEEKSSEKAAPSGKPGEEKAA